LSLHRVDPRFVLSEPVRRAAVLGPLDGWREGLAATGVEVHSETADARIDLVVASPERASEAAATRAPMLILDGRAPGSFDPAPRNVQRLLARPTAAEPALLLPLEQRLPTSYAIAQWSIVDRRWKVARRFVAQHLAAAGLWPRAGSIITTCQRRQALPRIVAEARSLGLPEELEWALSLGKGDVLSRNVFHLFVHGAREPDWVLKFARVPDYVEPFVRDERGLAIAAASGPIVAGHAPRLVGRFTWEGLHASVETAAVGTRLREVLTSPLRRSEKLRFVDTIAGWIVAFGKATAAEPEALELERRRLLDQVIPKWSVAEATHELVTGLPALHPVLQHNDLGSWNVLVRGSDFTAVDWESSRRYGLPLWDLFYFLADALALLDGQATGETRHEHTISLFRGDAPSSELLFRWVRNAVQVLAVPPEAVGRIATLCWLHHSLSHVGRRESLGRYTSSSPSHLHGTELVASRWLADEALRHTWNRWRA
jgi:hypothetical protein